MKPLSIKLDAGCYRDFIEKTAYMIFIVDETGRLLHVNEAWREALDQGGGTDSSQTLWHYLHPYSRMHCKEHFNEAEDGDRFDLELVFTNKEGVLVYTEGKFNCTYDAVNKIKVLTGILQDVTDRNLQEIEANTSKQNLEQLTKYWNLLNQAYLDLNEESGIHFDESVVNALSIFGKQVYADRAYIMMYDFVGMTVTNTFEWCSENIAPKKHDIQKIPVNFNDKWYKLHITGQAIYVDDVSKLDENDVIRKLTEPHGVKSFIALPMIKEGVCYGCVGFDSVTVHRTNADIEKWLLKELSSIILNAILRRNLFLSLSDRVSKMSRYLDIAPFGFFSVDGDGNYVEVNTTLCNMLGYTKEKVMKQTVKSIFGIRGQSSNCLNFDNMQPMESRKCITMARMASGKMMPISVIYTKGLMGEIFCYCTDPESLPRLKSQFEADQFIARDI